MGETPVHDVVIVGGGIAGVAAAERLSREALRSGRSLDIVLIESAAALGSGASGGLEGWFHTGALYAGAESSASLHAAMLSRDLLMRDYAEDVTFSARDACNVDTHHTAPGGSQSGFAQPQRWFADHLEYLLPEDALCRGSGRHRRIADRVEAASAGKGLAASAPGNAVTPSWTGLRLYPTLDRVMNSQRILTDLSRSAWANGVWFRCGESVEAIVPVDRGSGHLVHTSAPGGRGFLRARHVVLAACGSLAPGQTLSGFAPEGVPIDRRRNVMLALSAPLGSRSIVHVGSNSEEDFSHLVHRSGTRPFAIIADSGWREAVADDDADARAALRLKEKAARFFGRDAVEGVRSHPFACTKVEARPDGANGGGYSPWVASRGDGAPVCVLPGKFSFFPSCARQVVEVLRGRGLLEVRSAGVLARRGPCPVVAPMRARQLVETSPDAPIITRRHARPGERSKVQVWGRDESSAVL